MTEKISVDELWRVIGIELASAVTSLDGAYLANYYQEITWDLIKVFKANGIKEVEIFTPCLP